MQPTTMTEKVSPVTMDNELCLAQDFLIHQEPTLQELSALQLVIPFWYHAIEIKHHDIEKTYTHDKTPKLEDYFAFQQIPQTINDIIEKQWEHVREELYYCSRHFHYAFKPSFGKNYASFVIRNCHWQCGSLNYKKTATNMISNTNLHDEDRFQIICKYCLVDEIEKTTYSLAEHLTDGTSYVTDPLIFYWSCCLKNQLHELPIDDPSMSAGLWMIETRKAQNWLAIEYFWDRLDVEEQIPAAVAIILSTWGNSYYQTKLLRKMNRSQLRSVFTEIPLEIIRNFLVGFLPKVKFAMDFWIRLQYCVTNEAFVWLILSLIGVSSHLIDLWYNTSDSLKSYVLENARNRILERFFDYKRMKDQSTDIQRTLKDPFLLDFILGMSKEQRKNAILQETFIEGLSRATLTETRIVRRILKLCLPKDHRSRSEIFVQMIEPDHLSVFSRARLYSFIWRIGDDTDHVKNELTKLLDEHSLKWFKTSFIEHFTDFVVHDGIYWMNFDETSLRELLVWCLGNENEMRNWKNQLSLDDIFHSLDKYIFTNDHSLSVVPVFEKILHWYFVTPKNARKCGYTVASKFSPEQMNIFLGAMKSSNGSFPFLEAVLCNAGIRRFVQECWQYSKTRFSALFGFFT